MISHSRKTQKVFRYGTVSIVKWGKQISKPLTIVFAINYLGQPRENVVKILIEQIKNLELRIDYLTIDGGFATREVFQYLDLEKINFIARGRISDKKKYPGEVDGDGFVYQLFHPKLGNYQVYGYLKYIEPPKKKRQKITQLKINFKRKNNANLSIEIQN